MDELPDLHLDDEEEELVRRGPWWLVEVVTCEDTLARVFTCMGLITWLFFCFCF